MSLEQIAALAGSFGRLSCGATRSAGQHAVGRSGWAVAPRAGSAHERPAAGGRPVGRHQPRGQARSRGRAMNLSPLIHWPTVVAGFGSPHGDDQAGWRLAAMLERRPDLPARVIAVHEATQLLDALQDCQRLIIVDACLSGGRVGSDHAASLAGRADCGTPPSFIAQCGDLRSAAIGFAAGADAGPGRCVWDRGRGLLPRPRHAAPR